MIHQNDPLGAVSTDGVRAGATLRWLEGSGPRYAEVDFTLASRDFAEDDDSGMGDAAKLIGLDGRARILNPRQMSFASWMMVLDAAIGGRVRLKVRIDPVGQAAT